MTTDEDLDHAAALLAEADDDRIPIDRRLASAIRAAEIYQGELDGRMYDEWMRDAAERDPNLKYGHDDHCNTEHEAGPESCPPHCNDSWNRNEADRCPTCGSRVHYGVGTRPARTGRTK